MEEESEAHRRLDALLSWQFEYDETSDCETETRTDGASNETKEETPTEGGEPMLFRLFDAVVAVAEPGRDDSASDVNRAAIARRIEYDSDEEALLDARFREVAVDARTVLAEAAASSMALSHGSLVRQTYPGNQNGPNKVMNIPLPSPKRPHYKLRASKSARIRLRKKKSLRAATESSIAAYNAETPPQQKSSLPGLTMQYYKNPAYALALHRQRFSFWLGRSRMIKGERAEPVSKWSYSPSSRGRHGFGFGAKEGRGGGNTSYRAPRSGNRDGFSSFAFSARDSSRSGFRNRGGYGATAPKSKFKNLQ
ncbi:hypothetical protein BC830DRAFT_769912 [Chytriomyces sp. MP71]|nr:hypothetical protein BC830DRAFT_769912 [Chytriomyces sp. MP71]